MKGQTAALIFKASGLINSIRMHPNPEQRKQTIVLRGVNDTETDILSGVQRVQYAFKDSMIHVILQFTLVIAIRCVLHRYGSQEIHR